MPRIGLAARLFLVLLVALGQMIALVPEASAQNAPRLTARWEADPPNRKAVLDSARLAGLCPTAKEPNRACPIERGVPYRVAVQFSLDAASEPVLLNVDGGGLDVVATARSTGFDFTKALAVNQAETIDLVVTVPAATGRRDRSFYIGHIGLAGSAGRIVGSLTISLTVPSPRVTWGEQLNPTDGTRAPLTTIIGSGQTLSRQLSFTSTLDVNDFRISSNTDRSRLSGVPAAVAGGQRTDILMSYTAPIVNRRTTADVILRPVVGGLQALEKALRVRIIILPAEVTWSPPTLRDNLIVQRQQPIEHTIFMTSNYDVPGVRFKTADLGLTPIVSPLGTVDLKAGVPVPVTVRMCPGYAPTTYFLGITAYQANKPLNKRLQIRMKVEDDGTGLPAPTGRDPCAVV